MAAAQYRPNDLLRAARLRRGLSRSGLADVANRHPAMASAKAGPMTENFVGKLEQGRVAFPRPERRVALRAALGAATDADIGLIRTRDRRAGAPSFASDALVIDLATIVSSSNGPGDAVFQRLLGDLTEWATRVRRREVLQWLSWAAGAASAAPILAELHTDECSRLAEAALAPRRVDAAVVEHLEAVLWRCMRQDDLLGPQAALDTVLAQRGLVRTLLPAATRALHRRLLSLYANLSRFAGWLAFDMCSYAAATAYYETARAAAHEAEDTELGAFVLCNLSHLATWRGQARVGIDHALAAQGWATQTDDRQLQAYALDVTAKAMAKDGREVAAMRAIESAHRLLASAAEPSTHVYFFTAAHLESTAGMCLLDLGKPQPAVDIGTASLDRMAESFVRNRALASLSVGLARLRLNRPDIAGGAEALTEALRLAGHNQSPRLALQLRGGMQELARLRNPRHSPGGPERRSARVSRR